MNHHLKRAAVAAVALVSIASLAACSSSKSTSATSSTGPQYGGSLTIGVAQDPLTLDPIANGGYEANYMSLPVRIGLVSIDPSENIVPAIATSWSQPNPLTYIFHLRHGVRFSNGQPLTAKDVEYTFNMMMSPKSLYAGTFSPFLKSWEALNPYTFQINLKQPWISILRWLGENYQFGIIPDNWLATCGSTCNTTEIGAGPYMISKWVKGVELVLTKNPYYWAKSSVYLNTITWRVIPDAEAQQVALETGQIDLLYDVSLSSVSSLSRIPGVHIYEHLSGINNDLIFNTLVPPFNNVKVRQAVSLAINRQQALSAGLYGLGEVPTSVLPSFMPQYVNTGSPNYDPAEAKQLLQQAGYSAAHPLTFTLRTINGPEFINLATIVEQQLASIGVKVTVVPLEKAAFLAPMLDLPGSNPKSWQSGLEQWGFINDPTTLGWDMYAPSSFEDASNLNRPGGYQDPALGQLVTESLGVATVAAAKQEYAQMSTLLASAVPDVRLSYQDNVQAARSLVHGFQGMPGNTFPLWYLWVSS
jgi:peptide/nickel transport system substrate-binding protein